MGGREPCWLAVDVESSPLQELLKPFFILELKAFFRRKKDKSFIVQLGGNS